jgi:diguanylate cyclase (GGDEF)-like protein
MSEPGNDAHLWSSDSAPALSGDSMTDETKAVREPRYTPSWLIPQTVEGIGFSLADAVNRLTHCPAAVIVRDPSTETASVVAASIGADRRLLGTLVSPTSAVGRACMGDVTAYGLGSADLLGEERSDRRQREHQGVAFSLLEGRRSVGALVVFTPPELVDRSMSQQLATLAKQAGRVIGRTLHYERQEQEGLIDEITGQPNQDGLELAMQDLVRKECALVRVEIDQADELDPGMVNPVLRQIATILRAALREYDVPARLEGEGFAMFLPDTVLDHAVMVADRVRLAVSESDFDLGKKHSLTCSLGVASIPDTVADIGDLMEAASRALQQAKEEGRNRVVVAQA